jgi:hypothetical protein
MYIGSSKLSEHISYRSYAFWGHEWEDEMGQTCGTYGAVVNCRIISTGEPQKKRRTAKPKGRWEGNFKLDLKNRV